jgi:hypothetical protein
MKNSKGLINKMRSLLKNIDTYGIPVSLTYKKKPEIRSVIGGLFTIFA